MDCIVFGFDGQRIKLLVVHRAIEPEKNKWNLMVVLYSPIESADETANRILKN